MKERLLERIEPFVRDFVNDLLKLHVDAERRVEDTQKDHETFQKYKENIRYEEQQGKKRIQDKQDKLDTEVLKFKDLQEDVSNELSKYNNLNHDTLVIKNKIELEI